MRRRRVISGSVAIALGLAVACGEPSSNSPTRPSPSGIAGLQVLGPDSIGQGQQAQFLVNVRLLDGTMKAATSVTNLRWRSSNTSLIQVNAAGLATASQNKGEAILTADIAPSGVIRGTREVVVQPEGTYRVVGFVREAGAPTVAIVGARVEATPGPIVAFTDLTGQYRLYGVSPQATIRITAPGYETRDQGVQLSANITQNFDLNLDGARLALNGPYTILVEAISTCSGSPALAGDLRSRSYEATLTSTGSLVEVQLTEPRFRLNSTNRGNKFSGRLLGGGATFTLESFFWYYYFYYGPFGYPNVAERLPNGSYLVVEGSATVSGTAAGLTGTMSGLISNWDSRFPAGSLIGWCSSTNLRFTLTPR